MSDPFLNYDSWKSDNGEQSEVPMSGTLSEYELEVEYEDKLLYATFDIEIDNDTVVNMTTLFVGAVNEEGVAVKIKTEDYDRHKFLFDNYDTHQKILEENSDNENLY